MRSNEQSLKDVISSMLDEYRLKEKMNETKLVSHWEKIVGKTIARYTHHISVKNHKLYLQIDSSPLKNDLLYMKEKFIQRINEEIGEGFIQEVFIR